MNNEIRKAIEKLKDTFPFPHYCDLAEDAYCSIAGTVLRYLPRDARVLDFGSGPCDKTAVVQFVGYKCSACDDLGDDWHKAEGNREKILEFAERSGIEFRLLDGSRTIPFSKESFDMVMMHDVLEHLHDSPRELLNALVELIKTDGLLFLTVPNAVNIRKRLDVLRGRTNLPQFSGFYWYPGPWRGHIREYVRDDLAQLCKFLGLEMVELHGCHHMLHKLPNALRPLYMTATSIFDGWKDSWMLVARKPAGWSPKLSLSDDEMRNVFGTNCPHYLYQH